MIAIIRKYVNFKVFVTNDSTKWFVLLMKLVLKSETKLIF